ncbi:hypothetical protein F7R12_06120 [Pseudomonas tolaasii]|nr:hypothetical protein F7R12_06120 [Pseudomonas tolaasii]
MSWCWSWWAQAASKAAFASACRQLQCGSWLACDDGGEFTDAIAGKPAPTLFLCASRAWAFAFFSHRIRIIPSFLRAGRLILCYHLKLTPRKSAPWPCPCLRSPPSPVPALPCAGIPGCSWSG